MTANKVTPRHRPQFAPYLRIVQEINALYGVVDKQASDRSSAGSERRSAAWKVSTNGTVRIVTQTGPMIRTMGRLCPEHMESGECSAGEACQSLHGQQCKGCGRWCLHDSDPEGSQQHVAFCEVGITSIAACYL